MDLRKSLQDKHLTFTHSKKQVYKKCKKCDDQKLHIKTTPGEVMDKLQYETQPALLKSTWLT